MYYPIKALFLLALAFDIYAIKFIVWDIWKWLFRFEDRSWYKKLFYSVYSNEYDDENEYEYEYEDESYEENKAESDADESDLCSDRDDAEDIEAQALELFEMEEYDKAFALLDTVEEPSFGNLTNFYIGICFEKGYGSEVDVEQAEYFYALAENGEEKNTIAEVVKSGFRNESTGKIIRYPEVVIFA